MQLPTHMLRRIGAASLLAALLLLAGCGLKTTWGPAYPDGLGNNPYNNGIGEGGRGAQGGGGGGSHR